MSSDDFARLAYLVLLGLAVGGWFIASGRENWGKTAQQLAIWGLIFVGVVAAYGLWNDISRDIAPRQSILAGGTVEIPRGNDGHYALTLDINGTPVDFLVDTGASQMVLSQRDAARVGIDLGTLAYLGQAQTANGTVRTAAVRLETVTLGEISDTGLRAVVNEGDIDASLLGMTYLNLFERIEIQGDRMLLIR